MQLTCDAPVPLQSIHILLLVEQTGVPEINTSTINIVLMLATSIISYNAYNKLNLLIQKHMCTNSDQRQSHVNLHSSLRGPSKTDNPEPSNTVIIMHSQIIFQGIQLLTETFPLSAVRETAVNRKPSEMEMEMINGVKRTLRARPKYP
jgi:hypothetical protein